jgi:hypothetical protein
LTEVVALKVPLVVAAVGVAFMIGLAIYLMAAFQVAQHAIDQGRACQSAYDAWVRSGSQEPYTDPCTQLVLQPVPSYTFWSFAPLTLFPDASP